MGDIAAKFFATPAAFRSWLQTNHATKRELIVGFHKRHTGNKSMTWPESVAEALCFGWIDGVRRRIDGDRYCIRFSPRRPRSIWSAVNIRMMAELEKAGKVNEAGRAAFKRRTAARSGVYTYEQSTLIAVPLDRTRLAAFRRNKRAWAFFETLPPSYRKNVFRWIGGAKTEETKDRRFQKLLDACAAKKRLT